jgi:hypothetical protein
MTTFLVFLAVFAGTFWVILRLFRVKSSSSGGAITGLVGGVTNLFGPLTAKGWARPVAFLALLVVSVLVWDTFKDWFAGWFTSSDAGEVLGWQAAAIKKWLWAIPVSAVLLFVFWLFPNKIWRQLISAVVAVFALVVISLSLVTGETIFSLADGSAAKRHHGLSCTTSDDLRNVQIDDGGRDIVVCPENGPLYLFTERRYGGLVVDFSPQFKREYGHLLQGRDLGEFVVMQAPMTYSGSLARSWRILPLKSSRELMYTSGWDKSGFKDIVLTVRAE